MKISVINRLRNAIPSIVVAFYAIIPTLNLILVKINPSFEGLMSSLYKVGGILAFLFIAVNVHKGATLNKNFLFIFLTVVVAFLLTPNYGPEIELTTPYFIMFTLVPFIIPQFIKIDARIFSLFAFIIPSFGLLFPEQLFVLTSENAIGMDFSYSLLVPVISSIIYTVFYMKKERFIVKLFVIPFLLANLIYLFYMAFLGSRAPTLSVILCIIFIFIYRYNESIGGLELNRRRLRRTLFYAIFFITSFMVLVNAMYSFLYDFGIEAGALEKLMRLKSDGDLSNGRNEIIKESLNNIFKSPLWGYGVSSSPYVIHMSYPHNFIVQLLIDGGLIMTLVIMLPFLSHIRKFFKKCSFNDYAVITLTFFSSVIGALFSLDIWMNVRFWLFMGFLLSNNMDFNRSSCENTNNFLKPKSLS